MSQALETALSPAVLNHAWSCCRASHGWWRRGIPMTEVEKKPILHIGELVERVRAGRYRPEPLRCHAVPKASGGTRILCAAAGCDKLLQRAVLTVLEPLGEAIFHDASFGFRPHCTTEMALSRIREWVRRGWGWLGDADIRSCFDSIPQAPVLNLLHTLCGDRDVVHLAAGWLGSVPRGFLPDRPGVGLPQGLVVSPFLCNLYLHHLDCWLERHDTPFVRYADDFILLARSQPEAVRALAIAGHGLQQLGLQLHPQKSRVVISSPRHRFLGHNLPDGRPRFQP